MLGLLAGAAKTVGGSIVKSAAKDRAKSFITGKKKKVKPGAIKKKGGDDSSPGKGGALAVRPSSALVPAVSSATPISGAETASTKSGGGDTLTLIKDKVFEIDKVLKGTLAQQKAAAKGDRKGEEKAKRKKQENLLEKMPGDKKGSGLVKKLAAPAKGLFGGIFDFLKNILLGRLLVILIESRPNLPGGSILMFLAGMAEKIIDLIIGTIDALGSFLAWGQEKLDGAKEWLKENGGPEAEERFDGLLGALTNLFNAAFIVGSIFAVGGGFPGGGKKGSKPKPGKPAKPTKPVSPKQNLIDKGRKIGPTGRTPLARNVQLKHGHNAANAWQVKYDDAISKGKTPAQASRTANAYVKKLIKKGAIKSMPQRGNLAGAMKGSKITKGGLKKVPKRLATKVLGKTGIKAMKGLAKGFGKIPIVGPLIVAVSSLLAGEPIGQAVFKGIGAALGGALGSFIPIPVLGTILGESIGVLVGDMMYSLIMGGGVEEAGQKFMNALKTVMDIGGLILNFFKEGFQRFFENFPTIDISKVWMLPRALGAAAGLLGLEDLKSPNGKVEKLPDLGIFFNPINWITKLIPHAAASFMPDIFGEGGSAFGSSNTAEETDDPSGSDSGSNNQPTYTGNTSGTENLMPGSIPSVPQTGVAPPISGKGKAIYLHWTAGSFTNTDGPYHTVFTGDGTPHYKAPYTKQVNHTESRNKNSVGLSLAANPEKGWFPTEAQLSAMSKEAARIATGWGWSASDINLNKVMTHGEAGSNLDGMVATTNYGRFGRSWAAGSNQPEKQNKARGSIADFERYDLDVIRWSGINKPDTKFGAGGDEMRERISKDMQVAKSSESSSEPSTYNPMDPANMTSEQRSAMGYSKGGLVKKKGNYMLAELGPEFVLDADSTEPIEKMLPGFLDAINQARGDEAISVLMEYASYERPSETELVMAGQSGASSSGGDMGGEDSSLALPPSLPSTPPPRDSWKEIRYKFG
tara:strand:+ start:2597 stop:5515 length:2919 start_codon:yes stop_codon:yes gene_type:complete